MRVFAHSCYQLAELGSLKSYRLKQKLPALGLQADTTDSPNKSERDIDIYFLKSNKTKSDRLTWLSKRDWKKKKQSLFFLLPPLTMYFG